MALRCVTLVGFLVPVLVIPLGLLALRVLGVVAFYMVDERGIWDGVFPPDVLCESVVDSAAGTGGAAIRTTMRCSFHSTVRLLTAESVL